jgi:hypothetical protein
MCNPKIVLLARHYTLGLWAIRSPLLTNKEKKKKKSRVFFCSAPPTREERIAALLQSDIKV